MHFNMISQESSTCDHLSSGLGVSQQVPVSAHDSLSSLQAYLMLNGGLGGIHPRAVASTAPLEPLISSSPRYVSAPQISSVYDAHRVPSLTSVSVSSYSPMFTTDVEPSPLYKSSPPTPHHAVKSLLADCKSSDVSSTPSPEAQLEQLIDIKPLLRKPIDTTRMSGDQIGRLNRRRERNKAAATRCRIKRREKSRTVHEDLSEYSATNDELERELLQLQEEKAKLEAMLSSHTHLQNCHVFDLEREVEFSSPASVQSDCSVSSNEGNIFFRASPKSAASTYPVSTPPMFPARLLQRPPRLDFSSRAH